MPGRIFVLLVIYFLYLVNIQQSTNQVSGADDFPGWKAGDYPDPIFDPEACGLPIVDDDEAIESVQQQQSGNYTTFDNVSVPYTAWVCDPDGVLYEQEVTALVDLVTECHRESPCVCQDNCTTGGYHIAIAIVDRLNTEGEFQPMKTKARIFADEVRERWFENQDCGDSVLIFYTWHTNKLFVSLGPATVKVISDLELAILFETGKKFFKVKPKDYDYEDDWTTETNTTSTYLGMEALVRQVHAGIMNGSSMTSGLVFSIFIPVLLLVTLILMCLISNTCCSQDFLYDPTADKNTINRLLR